MMMETKMLQPHPASWQQPEVMGDWDADEQN